MYKAITGVTPENAMDRMLDDRLEPPSRLGAALPPHQEAALLKGLAIRQPDRYKTVSELYYALFGTTAQAPVSAPVQEPMQVPAQPPQQAPDAVAAPPSPAPTDSLTQQETPGTIQHDGERFESNQKKQFTFEFGEYEFVDDLHITVEYFNVFLE
jgi:hypothetical protein